MKFHENYVFLNYCYKHKILVKIFPSSRHNGGKTEDIKMKYKVLQCKLPGEPFIVAKGIESATIGKKFIFQLLSKMHNLGYNFVVSSDLNRHSELHQTDQVCFFMFRRQL